MEQIAFFWVGENIDIPSFLVKSTRLVYGKNVKIIQLSDKSTSRINGIDQIIRSEITNNMMVDRVNSYSVVETFTNRTLFVDADSIVLNKLNLDKYSDGIHIIKRRADFKINYNFPEYYPEFVNKNFCEVMPFLFGAIVINKNDNFFLELLAILKKLPSRFHRWYGDQYSLKKLYDVNPNKFQFIKNDFLYIVELDVIKEKKYLTLNKSMKLLTFKGNTKQCMGPIFNTFFNT